MAHPASETAVGPMTIVAVEQYEPETQRLIRDELAYHFLPSSVQRIVRFARWRPMRNLLIGVTEKTANGIWGSMLCRKRYIDDTIEESLGSVEAVVNLGAGFDTRAYRIPGLATLPIFEVDSPENIAAKRARLQSRFGQVPATVHLVPIDFEHQTLATTLGEHGYRTEHRTFFVWEAVTQYLSEEAVRTTFAFLAKAPPGSRLVFTYIRKDFLDGVDLYGAGPTYQRFRVKQQLWHFGMDPKQVGAFLDEYGWCEVEQLGSAEFHARYVAPTGRVMPVSEIERAVSAMKR
jgi:methyltransferase (TIGR00027 family)